MVKTLVDNSHKTLKDLKDEIVDNDEILNSINKRKILIKEERYINVSLKDLKKKFPGEIIKLEEALLNYIGENDPKIMKTELPDI